MLRKQKWHWACLRPNAWYNFLMIYALLLAATTQLAAPFSVEAESAVATEISSRPLAAASDIESLTGTT